MQTTSATWKQIFVSGNARLEAKAIINGVEYTDILPPLINRGLVQAGRILGNTVSASCQVTIQPQGTIPRSSAVAIQIRLTDGTTTSEWLPAGTYYISTRKRNSITGRLTLQCYDAMYKANDGYPSLNVSYPRSMINAVNDIATELGITVDARTTAAIHTGEGYTIPKPNGQTMMQVLSYIAALNGGNFCVSPENKLLFVPLRSAADAATAEEKAEVQAVVGGVVLGGSDSITGIQTKINGEMQTFGDDTGAVIDIGENPYATTALMNALITQIGGTVYSAYTIYNGVYDPAVEMGDYVVFGESVASVIFSENASLGVAFRGTISSPEQGEIEDEYPYQSLSQRELNTKAEAAMEAAGNAQDAADAAQETIDNMQVGATNLLLDTAAYPKGNNADKAELNGDTYQDCNVRYYNNTASSEVIYIRRAVTLSRSSKYVLSMWVKGSGTFTIRTQEANPVDFEASNGSTATGHAGVSFTLTSQWQRIWVRVSTRAWTTGETASKTFTIRVAAGTSMYSAGWQLEVGNMATDWYPAPEDAAHSVDTGSSTTGAQVKISQSYFMIDVPGTNGDLRLDADGGHLKKATIGDLECPNVAGKYNKRTSITVGTSNSHFLTLQEAFDEINNKVVEGAITITIQADLYETATLNGCVGNGAITINGGEHTLQGRLNLYTVVKAVTIYDLCVSGTVSSAIDIENCGNVYIYSSGGTTFKTKINGGINWGIYIAASKVRLQKVLLTGAPTLIQANYMSQVCLYDLGGSATGNSPLYLSTRCSVIHALGTRPAGNKSLAFATICQPTNPDTLEVDTGGTTPTPPVVPTVTTTLNCTASGTYNGIWLSDNAIQQASYMGDNSAVAHAGCMWFNTSAISGKQIISANITLKRLSRYGTWQDTAVYLYGTTATGKSGNPLTNAVDYGNIGSVPDASQKTLAVPVAAIQALANGTTKGLMLYANETIESGSLYSRNYSAYAGYGSSDAPTLTVTYSS